MVQQRQNDRTRCCTNSYMFLAKSLENMSLCHAVYFCEGWQTARGCKIEHEVAEKYGMEIIYEEN